MDYLSNACPRFCQCRRQMDPVSTKLWYALFLSFAFTFGAAPHFSSPLLVSSHVKLCVSADQEVNFTPVRHHPSQSKISLKALLHSKDKMRVFSTEQIHSSGGMWQHTRSRCCVRNTLWLKEWVQTHRAPAEYSPTDLSMHYLGNEHYPLSNIHSYTHRTIAIPLHTHQGRDSLETMCILTKFKSFRKTKIV